MTWGVEASAKERFAAAGVPAEKISFARDTFTFIYPTSPATLREAFRTFHGPTMNAFEAAEKIAKAGELQNELQALQQSGPSGGLIEDVNSRQPSCA